MGSTRAETFFFVDASASVWMRPRLTHYQAAILLMADMDMVLPPRTLLIPIPTLLTSTIMVLLRQLLPLDPLDIPKALLMVTSILVLLRATVGTLALPRLRVLPMHRHLRVPLLIREQALVHMVVLLLRLTMARLVRLLMVDRPHLMAATVLLPLRIVVGVAVPLVRVVVTVPTIEMKTRVQMHILKPLF
jgi:hypothetical protein